MDVQEISNLISHAQQLECHNSYLHQLLSSRIESLRRTIDLPEEHPADTLLEFVCVYIDHIPAFITALHDASQDVGIDSLIAPFLAMVEENFLAPVFQKDELAGLDVLLNKAYFTYRLIEEVNDNFVIYSGTALLPLNMTWANLIAHEILGDSFANELDNIVEQTVSNLISSQKIYDMEWFNQFIQSRDTDAWIDVWSRFRGLSLDTTIDLKFTSAYE